jgi:putative DNA primase/helicase
MAVSATDLLPALMAEKVVNPIIEFITSQKYGGQIDYMQILCDSLVVDNTDIEYRDLAVKTWLYQCVAAADSAKNGAAEGAAKFELVLVLQGEQGLGKTTWFKQLLPANLSDYVATGEHLNPDDTNSLRRCLSVWLCELGELDATFKKSDTERLKAFLSQDIDKIRLPYDRAISNYRRRTSFCGSVNPKEFLIDKTGNRRFLPIAVTQINRLNWPEIAIQQLWAQVWSNYTQLSYARWWCSEELEQMLLQRHATHSETSAVEELIADRFDMSNTCQYTQHYTATKLLMSAGIPLPNNAQIKQAKAFLEKHGFQSLAHKGSRGYWLAMNE